MKIALIVTAEPGESFVEGGTHARFAQLALPFVAASTPPGHDIRIYDEKIESLDPLPQADIAGITLHTALANRAYECARKLREQGTFVVLGGPHVAAVPEEAAQHADAIVIGDAEDTWPQLIKDFEKGKAEKVYQSKYLSLIGGPSPRYDLLAADKYRSTSIINASRGCPFACEFCSVPNVFGKTFRPRDPKQVADEASPHKGLMILWDDNVMGDRDFFLALCDELKKKKKYWATQATMAFANDREMVRRAADSGLLAVFLGMESFSKDSLKSARKGFNKVETYKQAVKNLHDHGIMAGAGLVFGFDADDAGVFQRTLTAADEIKLDAANFTMLTPFPGTPLYDRVKREGRLLTDDWSKYDPTRYAVMQPKGMTTQELFEGHRDCVREYYSAWPVVRRLARAPKNVGWLFTWFINWHYWEVKDFFWDESEEPVHKTAGSDAASRAAAAPRRS